jgi:hypothetical protein
MTFAEIVVFKSLPKVTFYSIRYEEEIKSETEKFFERFEQDKNRQDQIRAFILTLLRMGNETGATTFYFDRHEGFIDALPSKKGTILEKPTDREYPFDLRLFWLRLSPTVVVLFNGGIKNSEKMQNSPDLFPTKYRAAVKAAQALNQQITIGGDFNIVGKEIIHKYGEPLEITV